MSDGVTLKLRRNLLAPLSPPKPAQQFAWARVGPEIQLEVGHFDLPELRDAIKRAEESGAPAEATLNVTDRFVLSPQGVANLARIASEMMADMKKQGFVLEAGPDDTKH